MKKKILILIMLLFIICGCNAEVDIKIDKYSINEEITINDYVNENISKDDILLKYRKYIPVDGNIILSDTDPDERYSGIKYYTRTSNDIGNGYSLIYKYNHNFENYYNSSFVKNAFKSTYINYDKVDDKIIVSSDSNGIVLFEQYKDLNTIKVNLISDYEVITSNADSYDGKVYTWNFSRYNNKGIYIEYNVNKYIKDDSTGNNGNNSNNQDDNENNDDENAEVIEELDSDSEFSVGFAFVMVLFALLGFVVIVIFIGKIDRLKYK